MSNIEEFNNIQHPSEDSPLPSSINGSDLVPTSKPDHAHEAKSVNPSSDESSFDCDKISSRESIEKEPSKQSKLSVFKDMQIPVYGIAQQANVIKHYASLGPQQIYFHYCTICHQVFSGPHNSVRHLHRIDKEEEIASKGPHKDFLSRNPSTAEKKMKTQAVGKADSKALSKLWMTVGSYSRLKNDESFMLQQYSAGLINEDVKSAVQRNRVTSSYSSRESSGTSIVESTAPMPPRFMFTRFSHTLERYGISDDDLYFMFTDRQTLPEFQSLFGREFGFSEWVRFRKWYGGFP